MLEALAEFRASTDWTTLPVTGIEKQKSSWSSVPAATASYSFKILLITRPMLPYRETSNSTEDQSGPLGLPAGININCCKSTSTAVYPQNCTMPLRKEWYCPHLSPTVQIPAPKSKVTLSKIPSWERVKRSNCQCRGWFSAF